MIGIGKMGKPLVLNMLDNNHEVYAFDVNDEALAELESETGVKGTSDIDTFVENALTENGRRIFFILLPPGDITNSTVAKLAERVSENDVVIEGGNSNHKDSIANGELLAEKGAYFFDVGTSGGVSGARNGASFMIGGDEEVFKEIEPLFESLAVENGYVYTGRAGSGHFLKLVHNAIYYGIQQSLGEGLEILHESDFDYDLATVTKSLNESAVIRSFILEVAAQAFEADPELEQYSGHVKGSKSTAWVITEAMEMGVPVPAMSAALSMRHRGVQDDRSFSGKVVAAIRSGVGGYAPKGK